MKAVHLLIVLLAVLVSTFIPAMLISQSQENQNNEGLTIHGHFTIVARHQDGTIFAERDLDNLVTTNGFKGVSNLMFAANSGITPSTYRYLAIGSGSTAASASDTALGTECGYSRQLTSSPGYSSGVTTLTGTFTGASCTAAEVGVFDASTSGNMVSRQVYSTITLGSSDSMTVTYTFTVT